MLRQLAHRLISRSTTNLSACAAATIGRPYSIEVSTEASASDSAFVEAWKKVAPNIDPPKTPIHFMEPRPPTPSILPSKLTVNFQSMGLFSSRRFLSTNAIPGPSPLTPPTLAIEGGKAQGGKAVSKPSKVQAVLKRIKQSPKKMNLVAKLVRGMLVEDAIMQLQLTIKRAAKTVLRVVCSARANATHNFGFDASRLIVAEAFVGKGVYLKRTSYHAKGRSGIRERAECRLTVIVREITPEEEAEIAKLKVSKFKKLTKRQRQLVPHKLIETTPIWDRKSKHRNHVREE